MLQCAEKNLVLGQLVSELAMGGAQNLAVQIANAHAQAGRPSHMVVLGGKGPLSSRLDPLVKVHYLGYKRASIRKPFQFIWSVSKGIRILSQVVRENRIQVLQTHLPRENLWGLALEILSRCAVVITIHNNNFLGQKQGSRLGQYLIPRLYRYMFRHCGAVVACSEEVKFSVLNGLGIPEVDRTGVFTVTNGVLPPPDLDREEIDELRKIWCKDPRTFNVLAAGRLSEAKNFACLVQAMSLLRTSQPEVRLLIAGEGELKSDLEKQVRESGLEDTVSMPGNLEDLPRVMSAADCLVMSSRWEGLPLVLLEAMSRGLPIVGTRIKGIADTIEEGKEGLLVEVDDPEGLADGISRLVEDPEGARAMGQRGQDLVERKYSFARVYSELCAVYDFTLDRSANNHHDPT